MQKINLLLFKLKNLIIITKSRVLKKKIKSKYSVIKKKFENLIETKNFSKKWFLNNFEIFHHYLPKDTAENFAYLEIGSYEGLSALNILFNYKNAKVTAIDLWTESNINSESLNVNFNEIEGKFIKNLDGYEYNKIKSDSVIALRKLLKKNSKFDFIYIDGSHNGEDILSDAIEAYKLLNTGGFIIFDDVININRNISIQSFVGFEKFCQIYKKKIKILYLKNIAVIKKTI